VEPKRYKISLL